MAPLEASLEVCYALTLVGFSIGLCRAVVFYVPAMNNRLTDVIILGIMLMF